MMSPDQGMSADEAAASTAAEALQAAGQQPITDEQPTPQVHWPQAPAVHGGIYSFACPHHGTRLIAVTLETFVDLRQTLERMRGNLTDQQAENIRLFQENQQLQAQLTMAVRPKTALDQPGTPRIITPRGGM